MLLILFFLLCTILFIWFGKRRESLLLFAISFAMAVVWFMHQLDTQVVLQL